jgi:hypothetical protein
MVGSVDITDLNELLSTPEMDTLFKKYEFHFPSADVASRYIIYLIWLSNSTVFNNNEIVLYKFEELAIFKKPLDDILNKLSSIYPDCIPVKVMIHKIKPNVVTHKVRLTVKLVNNCHRIIIPIVPNDDITYNLENNKYQMNVGEMYRLETKAKSIELTNKGNQYGIHLIIDMLPTSYINSTTIIRDVIITESNQDDFKL